ncbi:MAG: sugar ABC transporter ATP-binding protein [Akkermansiaceae bacterium]|nr:sugar ABC transporter ATP-binding protein [Akkermansiaceae bacterium]
MIMPGPLVQIENLSRSFGGVHALGGVSFDIAAGEVHGLCGENGAGKSTLIKCLAGVIEPDRGTIRVEGTTLRPGDIHAAEQAGIAAIYQESTSFLDLDLVDNLFVGREIRRGLLLDRAAMEGEARAVLQRLGLDLELDRPLRELSVAQRQMVEMARALLRDCRLLIMDEPTASLSVRETEILMAVVRRLRRDGVSVLYVTHRLPEVFDLCDRVTVLRDGHHVATTVTGAIDHDGLIQQMVGREVETLTRHGTHEGRTRDVLLKIENLTSENRFSGISFDLHAGEILGIGGLVGAGRSEVARAIFGIDTYDGGTISLAGQPLPMGSIRASMDAGIALVPEDRQHEGLVLPMTVRENLSMAILPELIRHVLISPRREAERTAEQMERLNVRAAGPEMATSSLSGGNQQKVVLGKWLANHPRLLILDEPTRGVDVGAKAEIHRLVREFAAGGMATLVISSDLPELLALCDRILVMRGGEIAGELDGAGADEESVMRLAFPAGEEPVA